MITSTKNKHVQYVKKLQKAKYRKMEKAFVLEGYHLLEEAVQAGVSLRAVYYSESGKDFVEKMDFQCALIEEVTDTVLKAMSTLPTPQGILAVADELCYSDLDTVEGKILLLDQVQDPGNVGTMIRTADAAGYQAVVLNEGSADLYHPKVLRAMQGSQYHLPIYMRKFDEFVPKLLARNWQLYGTELNEEAVDYRTIHPQGNFAVIMGNEGQGVSPEFLAQTTQNVYLPMPGQAESLNVAVATGILLFQWL